MLPSPPTTITRSQTSPMFLREQTCWPWPGSTSAISSSRMTLGWRSSRKRLSRRMVSRTWELPRRPMMPILRNCSMGLLFTARQSAGNYGGKRLAGAAPGAAGAIWAAARNYARQHAPLPGTDRSAARPASASGPRPRLDAGLRAPAGGQRLATAPPAGRQRLGRPAGPAGRLAAPARRAARAALRVAGARQRAAPGTLLRTPLAIRLAGRAGRAASGLQPADPPGRTHPGRTGPVAARWRGGAPHGAGGKALSRPARRRRPRPGAVARAGRRGPAGPQARPPGPASAAALQQPPRQAGAGRPASGRSPGGVLAGRLFHLPLATRLRRAARRPSAPLSRPLADPRAVRRLPRPGRARAVATAAASGLAGQRAAIGRGGLERATPDGVAAPTARRRRGAAGACGRREGGHLEGSRTHLPDARRLAAGAGGRLNQAYS